MMKLKTYIPFALILLLPALLPEAATCGRKPRVTVS